MVSNRLGAIYGLIGNRRTWYIWARFPSEPIFFFLRYFPFSRRIRKKATPLKVSYLKKKAQKTIAKMFNMEEREVSEVLRNYVDPYPRYIPKGVPYREFLYAIVVLANLKTIVETGVAYGSSTYAFLLGLEETGGELYSIDISPEVGSLVPKKLRRRWTLVIGDSRKKLPELLKSLKEIDAFMHDSIHTPGWMLWEYTISWPYVKKILLSDDAHQNNAFPYFAKVVKKKPYYVFNRLGVLKKS